MTQQLASRINPFPIAISISLPPAIPNILPSASFGTVKKKMCRIIAKWELTPWAKKRAAAEKRRALTDLEDFQVMKRSRCEKVREVLKGDKAGA